MSSREEIIKEIYKAESKLPALKVYTLDEITKEVIEEYTDIALKVIEKRIDKMIKVAYEKDPVSVWSLTQVKEMLSK